jgi:hypothetical protein
MKMLCFGLLVLSFVGVITPARAEHFSMSTRTIEIPESGEVTNTVLRIETHEFTFLPPTQWKSIINDKAGVITWTSGDYRSVLRLSITVSTNRSGQPTQNRPEELKHVVLQELPAARIIEQFNCYTATGAAVAFDLERLLDDKHSTALRVVFLPFSGGYVQIRLTAAIEDFFDRQVDLTRFLNSFRIDPVKPQ